MDTLDVHALLQTPTVELHDVCCRGLPVEPAEDEFTSDLRLVFPYRGVFVRHVGDDQAVAEAEPGSLLQPPASVTGSAIRCRVAMPA